MKGNNTGCLKTFFTPCTRMTVKAPAAKKAGRKMLSDKHYERPRKRFQAKVRQPLTAGTPYPSRDSLNER